MNVSLYADEYPLTRLHSFAFVYASLILYRHK